jgi:carbon monoxide dehydrogenase subunit G
MINFSKTVYIERPQQEVFDFLADPTNDPKWRDSSVSAELVTPGPVGVGSQVKSVDKLMGRKIEGTVEFTHWDPPHKFGQKAIGGPIPFESLITLDPKDTGTEVRFEGQAEIGGFFKLAEGLAGRQLEKQIEADLAGLKRTLEAGSA